MVRRLSRLPALGEGKIVVQQILPILTNGCEPGETALHISAQNGYRKVMKLLLDKGANTEAALHIGATALYISAQDGHPEIVKLLLDKGAMLEARTNRSETAVEVAVKRR